MNNEENKMQIFSRSTWIIIAIVGIFGLVYLLKDHKSHVFSVIPYLILLLCPLMHISMHKNHGKHKDNSD